MPLTADQQRIIDAIHATHPVSDEEANWAVEAGYAARGEDGDIDLTPQGRHFVDATRVEGSPQ